MAKITSSNLVLVHVEQGRDMNGQPSVDEQNQPKYTLKFLQLTSGEIIAYYGVSSEFTKGLQIGIPKEVKQYSTDCDQFKTKVGGTYNKLIAIKPLA